ncbi:RDD family protein [Solwaraspora sp. WMMD791]|uniref:RDD family protein n=1 Tax=Solwaraspora sp. WMMD791 TaxID=3016086 RepID=UPI002499C998|nr:RDD family protein [Solwaraspora sp. WMMD791]WFE24900.1 RDD family protein [Solwaraspora sp. WMMD791]
MSAHASGGTRLVGGEAVEVEVRLARAGSRILALLVDLLVQVLIALLLAVVAGVLLASLPSSVEVDDALGQAVLTVGAVLVLVGYPVLCETLGNGRTVGKRAVGIRVVRDDGGPPQFRHALTRNLVGVAAEWPGLLLPPLTWLASLVTLMSNSQGKRLGDLAAGTIVVHDRAPASWGWVPGMPPALAGWARTLDLTRLDDELALSVRHLLTRGHGFAEPARSELVRLVAADVAAVTTPPPPAGVPGWAYLAAVLAERHRRSGQRLVRSRAASAALWPELAGLSPARTGTLRPAAPPSWADPLRAPDPAGAVVPTQRDAAQWPRGNWPRPPWMGPTSEQPDWTGVRRPPVASTLRRASVREPTGPGPDGT